MGFIRQTLPFAWGALFLHSFSLLLPLEQALPELTVEVSPVFFPKLEVLAVIAIVLLHCLTLEPVALVFIIPSISSLLSCFPPSSYLEQ